MFSLTLQCRLGMHPKHVLQNLTVRGFSLWHLRQCIFKLFFHHGPYVNVSLTRFSTKNKKNIQILPPGETIEQNLRVFETQRAVVTTVKINCLVIADFVLKSLLLQIIIESRQAAGSSLPIHFCVT